MCRPQASPPVDRHPWMSQSVGPRPRFPSRQTGTRGSRDGARWAAAHGWDEGRAPAEKLRGVPRRYPNAALEQPGAATSVARQRPRDEPDRVSERHPGGEPACRAVRAPHAALPSTATRAGSRSPRRSSRAPRHARSPARDCREGGATPALARAAGTKVALRGPVSLQPPPAGRPAVGPVAFRVAGVDPDAWRRRDPQGGRGTAPRGRTGPTPPRSARRMRGRRSPLTIAQARAIGRLSD